LKTADWCFIICDAFYAESEKTYNETVMYHVVCTLQCQTKADIMIAAHQQTRCHSFSTAEIFIHRKIHYETTKATCDKKD